MQKRIISFLLALVLVIGTLPPTAVFASETETEPVTVETVAETTEAIPEETTAAPEVPETTEAIPETTAHAVAETAAAETEETLPLETVETLEASAEAANALLASGTCGAGLTWQLSDDGVLNISGSGPMTDFFYDNNHPWHPYRESIVEAYIDDGVTSIGDSAFYQCANLESVRIPEGVTRIGQYAFRECGKLTAIAIPGTVKTVTSYAFLSCDSLRSFTLGEGVETLNDYVLDGAAKVTEITIPASVTKIWESAFIGGSSLENIYVNGNNPNYCDVDGVLFTKDKATLHNFPRARTGSYTVPDYVTRVGNRAFLHSMLEEVILPDGLTAIEKETFYGSELEHIYIPDSVTVIEEMAFSFAQLKNVTIPAGVERIEDQAFYYNYLETVTFEGDAPTFGTLVTDDMTGNQWIEGDEIFNYNTFKAYYPGDNATWTADKLQNYGGTITWVPYGKCGPDVEWVYDPTTKTLTLSGTGETYDYGGSGEPWEPYMGQMEHLVIDEEITYLSENGFRGLDHLKTMTHSGELETWDAFQGRLDAAPFETLTLTGTAVADGQVSRGYMPGRNAPTVVLSEGITSIGEAAFMYCNNIQNLTLPESLTTIGEGAFGEADGLTAVTFPIGLTALGDYAFFDNSALAKITFQGNAPAIGGATFTNVVADAYYPQNNATWTADKLQNYGGTLNWIPYNRAMIQSELETLLSGPGNITLNEKVILTEDLTIDLGSRIFTIGPEGQIIIPGGVKLEILSRTEIHGSIIQESGSWLETTTGNGPAILNTYDDGFLFHSNGCSWSVSLNGQAYHEWDVLTGLTAKHLNTMEDGLAVADRTNSVSDSCRLLPGNEAFWIFYFREWDPVNYRFTNTLVRPEELQVGPYLAMTVLEEEGHTIAPGQENGDCFVRVAVEDSSSAWDNDSYVRYTRNGETYDLTVSIRRDYDMGFYSSTVASNETYADNVMVHPLSDTGEIYFIVTNPEWNVNGVQLNRGAENFTLTRISDKVYKITLKKEAAMRIYQRGGYNVSVMVDLSDGKGWEGHWGCGDVWFQAAPMDGKEQAYFMMMGGNQSEQVVYSYYGALGGFGYIGDDGIIVEQTLPQGVSYDYASNTITLNNAALADFGVVYSSWQDDQGNTYSDLPSKNLQLKLIGSNAISNHIDLGGSVNLHITGSGNITLGTMEIQPDALLRIDSTVAFDSGTVNQMGRMHIYDDVLFRGNSQWFLEGSATVNSGGSVTVEDGAVLRFNQGGIDVNNGTLTVKDGAQISGLKSHVRLWLYDGHMLNSTVTGIDNSNILARSNVATFDALKRVIAAGEGYGKASVSLTSSSFDIEEDYTIPGNTTVIIEGYPDPITVTVPAGVTLTNEGTIRIYNGELVYVGTVVNNGTVTLEENGSVTELGGTWEGKEPGAGGYVDGFVTSVEDLKALMASGYSGSVQIQGHLVIDEEITLPDEYYLNIWDGSSLTVAGTLTIPNGNIHVYDNSALTVVKGGKIVLGTVGGIYAHGGRVDVQSGGKILFEGEWARMEAWDGAEVTGLKKNQYIRMCNVETEQQLRQAMTVTGYKETVAVVRNDIALRENLTIPKGVTVSLGYNGICTLTVSNGVTLTVKGLLEAFNMGHVQVNRGGTLENSGMVNISENGLYTNNGSYINANCTYFVYHVFSIQELNQVLALNGRPTEVYYHGDLRVNGTLEVPADMLLVVWGDLTVPEGAELINRGVLVADWQTTMTVEAGGKLTNYGAVDTVVAHVNIYRYHADDLNSVVNYGHFSYDPALTHVDYCRVELEAPDALVAGKTGQVIARSVGNPFTDDVIYWLAPGFEDMATLTVKDGIAYLTPGYRSESGSVVTVHAACADGLCETAVEVTVLPAAQKLELTDNGSNITGSKRIYDLARMDGMNVILCADVYPVDAHVQLQWSSSNPDAVSVDANGKLTLNPNMTGTAVITVKDTVSGLTASVTVETVRRAAKLQLICKETDSSLVGGSKATFTVQACDAAGNILETVKNNELVWSVTDSYGSDMAVACASVDAKGKMTTKAVNVPTGICVTARYADDPSVAAYMELLVVPAIGGVNLTNDGDILNGLTIPLDLNRDGRDYQLGLEIPSYGLAISGEEIFDANGSWKQYVKDWTWASSKPDVAVVDRTGRLQILGTGKAKITLTVEAFNGKKASASFTLVCGSYDPTVWVDTPNSQEPWQLESDCYLGELRSGETMTFSNAKVTLVNTADKAYVTVGKDGSVTAKNVLNPVMNLCLQIQSKDGYALYENLSLNVLPAEDALWISRGDDYIVGTTQVLAPGDSMMLSVGNVSQYLWTTSDATVADVDSRTGTVSGKNSGTATITAVAQDGTERSASFKVNVTKVAKDVKITDNIGSDGFYVASGKNISLAGNVTFSDGSVSSKAVTWRVSDEWGNPTTLAKIAASGKLTAAKNLREPVWVTVWAESKDGAAAASAEVCLYPAATGIDLYGEFWGGVQNGAVRTVDLRHTDRLQLSAQAYPAWNAGNMDAAHTVTWKSSAPKIASVDEDGTVTLHKPGTVTITAASKDNGKAKAAVKLQIVQGTQEIGMEFGGMAIERGAVVGGKSLKLKALLYANSDAENRILATSQKAIWSLEPWSDGYAYATLDAKGNLKTRKVTELKTVTVCVAPEEDPENRWYFDVEIWPEAVMSVEILNGGKPAGKTMEMQAGQWGSLDTLCIPGNGRSTARVVWKSSKPDVVSVDAYGNLQCLKPGKANLTATAVDGSKKSAKITVTVK